MSLTQALQSCRSLVAYNFRSRSPQDLSSELHRSFSRYLGKDTLMLVTSKDRKPNALPKPLVPLDRYGVPTRTLQSLLIEPDCACGEDSATSSTTRSGDDPSDEVVEEAVRKLQKFWNKRRPYLHSHRKALESLDGMANALIFDSIRHVPLHGIPGDSNLSIIRRNHILLTLGVNLYVNIWKLRIRADKVHTFSGRVLANPNVSVESLEDLIAGDWLKNLEGIRRELGKDGNTFEKAGSSAVSLMYLMEWEVMKDVFEKLNAELGEMEIKLNDIVDRLQSMNK